MAAGSTMGKPPQQQQAKRPDGAPKAADKARAALAAARSAETRISGEEAKRKFIRIDSFEGLFDFLALEFPCQVSFESRMFGSAKAAVLAAQFPKASGAIAEAKDAEEAKKEVHGEKEADDWASRRLQIMERILRDKFRRSDEFRKRLKETGDRELVWDNDDDVFWGSTKGRGQNQLGRILMDVRKSVQDDSEFEAWLFICCDLETDALKRPPVELLEAKTTGGAEETKQVHRLNGHSHFKLGKLPHCAVVALHPSVSREHTLLVHTKSSIARKTGGLAIIDLGSKASTWILPSRVAEKEGELERKLPHAFVMEPLRNLERIKLGASTRSYEVRINLASQIEQLEQQQRELLREVRTIDQDAADPIEAAKRAAREEATVFVGNLDYETEKADLLGLFQDCGHVQEVRFPGEPEVGGKSTRGIAFVIFDSAMAARRACGLSGELFKGRKVKVAPAAEGRREAGKGDGKGKGKGKSKDAQEDDRGRSPQGSRALAFSARDGRGRRDRSWSRGRSPPEQARRDRDLKERSRSRECQVVRRRRSASGDRGKGEDRSRQHDVVQRVGIERRRPEGGEASGKDRQRKRGHSNSRDRCGDRKRARQSSSGEASVSDESSSESSDSSAKKESKTCTKAKGRKS